MLAFIWRSTWAHSQTIWQAIKYSCYSIENYSSRIASNSTDNIWNFTHFTAQYEPNYLSKMKSSIITVYHLLNLKWARFQIAFGLFIVEYFIIVWHYQRKFIQSVIICHIQSNVISRSFISIWFRSIRDSDDFIKLLQNSYNLYS